LASSVHQFKRTGGASGNALWRSAAQIAFYEFFPFRFADDDSQGAVFRAQAAAYADFGINFYRSRRFIPIDSSGRADIHAKRVLAVTAGHRKMAEVIRGRGNFKQSKSGIESPEVPFRAGQLA
jgi:hypothetical protein